MKLQNSIQEELNVLSGQTFQMSGIRMPLNTLKKLEDLESSNDITPAGIVVLIALHSMCDSAGVLPDDFSIKKLETVSKLPYSTARDGFLCITNSNVNLVKESFLNGKKKSVYEIVDYERENRAQHERPHKEGNLNYFRIPHRTLTDGVVFTRLVKSSNVKGLLFLLQLFNRFTRVFQYPQKQLDMYSLDYKMVTLKEKLGTTSKKVREFLEVISPFFKTNYIDKTERNPNPSRTQRVRKAVTQLWIRKVEFTVTGDMVTEKQQVDKDAEYALREAFTKFKHFGISMTNKERIGLRHFFFTNVVDVIRCLPAEFQKNRVLKTMSIALEQLEKRVREKDLLSPGGLLNATLTNIVNEYISIQGHKSEAWFGLKRKGKKCPKILRDSLKMDENYTFI